MKSLFRSPLLALLLFVLPGCCGIKLSHRCKDLAHQPGTAQEIASLKKLQNWNFLTHTNNGISHQVWFVGSMSNRPPVLVFHELPGFTPEFIRLCETLSADGFAVYAPLFFGKPGDNSTMKFTIRVLMSSAWAARKADETPKELDWARSLVAEVAKRHPNQNIGALGNCLTGGFPLGLLSEDPIQAVVLSQPSLPFNCNERAARSTGLSPSDWATSLHRIQARAIPVLAFRCAGDTISPSARFETLEKAIGTNLFLNRTIQLSEYGCFLPKNAHAILTTCYASAPTDHPCQIRLSETLAYLHHRLDQKH